MIKKLMLLAMCFCIALSCASMSAYADSMDVDESSEVFLNQNPYSLTPLDEEWYALPDVYAMRAACEVDSDLLEQMTTEDLVCGVLDYPLLCDLYAFDSLEDGYEAVKSNCNVIDVLLQREDAYSCLLAAYSDFAIPVERIVDYDALFEADAYSEFISDRENVAQILSDAKIRKGIAMLELLLCDCLASSPNLDSEIFAQAYISKLEEKLQSTYYTESSALETLDIIEEEISNIRAMVESGAQICCSSCYTTQYTIYSPNDRNAYTCTYSNCTDYADASEYTDLIATYDATYVTKARKSFNCHSYAWLSVVSEYKSIYQNIWMNSFSFMATDSYFQRVTDTEEVQAGDIACTAAHSAFVVEQVGIYSNGNYTTDFRVISKWGTGPLVKHLLSKSPYANGTANEYYTY